jgi:polysaccharide biosynthesis protein PslJ
VRAIAGSAERGPVVSAAIVLSSLLILSLTVPAGLPALEVSLVVILGTIAAVAYRRMLTWRSLLATTVLVVLFIPIKRYSLPGNLPFELEPYRLFVAFIVVLWIAALLVDPRARLRTHGFEAPMLLIVVSVVGSVLANGPRISELGVDTEVTKALTFFLSFWLVVYLLVSVVRTFELVEHLVKVMVAGGAVVALFSLFEARTGFNIFNNLDTAIPILNQTEIADSGTRGGALRANGSAQGAIPLGGALVLLIPVGVYLAKRVSPRWWFAVGLLALGALSTRSRTGVVMMAVLVLAFLWLRPKQTRRFIVPALVPAVVIVHFALPGTIGTLQSSFFPEEGLIAQQSKNAGSRGSGRIADLGPALDEWARQPVLGQGYATRLTGREHRYTNRSAQILDNQWLKSLLETGVAGVIGWIWLYARVVRRTGKRAKKDTSDYGWLLAAISGSVLAFAVGSYFYDAFSFIQVTFLFYVLMGLGAALLAMPEHARSVARPVS